MSSSDQNRNGPDDEEVARAFAALGRTIRDGHLDGFASKVLARLDAGEEVTDMDARRDAGRGSGQNKDIGLMTMTPAGRESGSQRLDSEESVTERTPRVDAAELEHATPLPGDATVISPKPREENSGLHEIKALAKSAKQRMSQRMSSQSESEESLLKEATSSGSFRAVALPDPKLQTAPPQVARSTEPAKKTATKASAEVAAVASAVDTEESSAGASFQPRLLEQPKGPPYWLLGGVAVVAAAALVAVFVFDVGRSSKSGDGQVASAPTSESAAPVADQASSAEQPAAAAQAPVAEPLVEAEPEGGEAAAGSAELLAAANSSDEDEDQNATEGSSESRDSARAERRAARANAADKGDDDAKRAQKEAKQETAKGKAGSTSSKSADIGVSSGAGGQQDLESVLDSVTGGVDSIKDAEVDKPAKPKKKELDRRDVSSAMDKIRGSAIRCGEVEGYTSSVSVKFVVDPSGKVSSAKVVGAKAGTMTGDCVVSAVKRAKFPPFDGSPTTFTFPFLLAE